MVQVCVVHERSTSWNQSDFKSLKAICADDSLFPQKLDDMCVCTSRFGSVIHSSKETEDIAQWHGRKTPSLELIKEPWIGERIEVRESVSVKLGEQLCMDHASSRLRYKEVRVWLAFHGGILFTSGMSVKTTGMFWNVFSGFATCVYSLVGDHSFVTCHKSVFISVSTELHTF